MYRISAEGFWKDMRNLLEYKEEYYQGYPYGDIQDCLTSGKGSAKGIDLLIEKKAGRFKGHVAYSLLWADRQFRDLNGGRKFPGRFDNRHKINLLLSMEVNSRIELSLAWTGHSGDRVTLPVQSWQAPDFEGSDLLTEEVPLNVGINNYQLPFYHRLDLGMTLRTGRGYWNFGLYNAYCNMNTVAIRRAYRSRIEKLDGAIVAKSVPVFKKFSLLPIIPSFSYTWIF